MDTNKRKLIGSMAGVYALILGEDAIADEVSELEHYKMEAQKWEALYYECEIRYGDLQNQLEYANDRAEFYQRECGE